MSSTTSGGPSAPPPPPGEDPGDTAPRTQSLRQSLSERIGTQTAGSAESAADSPRTSAAPPPADSDPAGGAGSASRPVAAGPRKVRLSISRVDPWSVMKLSFLLSVAIGIMIVVAFAVVWLILDAMQLFAAVEDLLESIGSEDFLALMDYLEFDRVVSFATIVAVFDVLLLTALGTIMAFLYNITAALVGGLHMTLTDE